jgi:hypothetical protein
MDLDVEDVELGHTTKLRWNDSGVPWLVSPHRVLASRP